MRPIRRTLLLLALVAAGCGGGDKPEAERAASTPAPPAPTPANITCDEVAYTPKPTETWAHPSGNFYEPGTEGAPTTEDLEHLLAADNAIVVSYPANSPADALNKLRKWSGEQTASVVVADTAADAPPLRAKIATAMLTCDGVDVGQLSSFADKRGDSAPVPHSNDGS